MQNRGEFIFVAIFAASLIIGGLLLMRAESQSPEQASQTTSEER